MSTERRNTQRFPLMHADFACLLVNNQYELFGTIENLSEGGIQLEMFPTSPAARPVPGDEVAVLSCPMLLAPLLSDLAGRVAWICGHGLGMAFDAPLEQGEGGLLQRLRDMDLLPWVQAAD